MKKILYINTKYAIGGASAIANTLYTHFKNNDYSCNFLYGRGHGFNDDEKASNDKNAIRISNKNTILLNFAYSRINGYDRFSAKDVKKNKYLFDQADIIHLHNLHGYVWNPFDIIKLIPDNKKVIWTIHDLWLITGRCAFPFECQGYLDNCSKCLTKNNYPRAIRECAKNYLSLKTKKMDRIWKNITFVTPSDWAKATLLNSKIFKQLSPKNIKVINNGINKKIFFNREKKDELRKKYNIPLDKKIVLFVSEILNDERKGIKYIFELINQLKNTPEIIFIGIGKEKKDLEYKNLIQTGFIGDRNSLAEYYSLSDAFLLPSLDDNYPTTALEAVNSHTPVIAFNVGGIPEIIKNNINGFISEKGNTSDLKSNLLKALDKKDFDFTNKHLLSNEDFIQEYQKLYR